MKQHWKKYFAVLLVFLLTFSLPNTASTSTQIAQAAAKVSLSKTSASLAEGSTLTLKLNNNKSKVKWATTNSSIATVDTKGKVTAKSKGSATITATVGSKKYSCKVTVTRSTLKVHFIDVGQGDAILVQLNGVNTLIDTGTEKTYPQLKSYLKKLNVKKIHNLILTHPDADHMGAADYVIRDYTVVKVYSNGYTNTTNEYKELVAAVNKAKLKINVLKTGDTVNMGYGAKAKVLAPSTLKNKDSNESSLVIRLDYYKNSFLFTGDIPAKEETALMAKHNVKADVLKVSHHGGNTSSAVSFIKKVSPTYSIISVGANNNYGHPTKEVLNRLTKYSKNVLRTDKSGTIVVSSTGDKLSYTTVKTASSSSGSGTSSKPGSTTNTPAATTGNTIGNKKTKKYHKKSCRTLPDTSNRVYFKDDAAAKKSGYVACKNCH